MDREFNKRLADYFDADALVDLLGVTTEEVVDAFQDQITDQREDLEEYLLNGK